MNIVKTNFKKRNKEILSKEIETFSQQAKDKKKDLIKILQLKNY